MAMVAVLAMALAACGSAAGRIAPDILGVSARDAHTEARSVARVWSQDARLRWVEGEGINPEGIAVPDGGAWQFHYTAPGKTQALYVRVQALDTDSEERPPASPPGFVIGDNDLSTDWVDSRIAMQAVAAAAGQAVSAPVSMLLVPTRPEQWVIRVGDARERWRVDAATGEVVSP